MMPNAIREISSGGRRRASLSGTSEPSTRNMGGRPALRWMSEAPPRSATCKISFSSILASALEVPRRYRHPGGEDSLQLEDDLRLPERVWVERRPAAHPVTRSRARGRVHVPAGVLIDGQRDRVEHLQHLAGGAHGHLRDFLGARLDL